MDSSALMWLTEKSLKRYHCFSLAASSTLIDRKTKQLFIKSSSMMQHLDLPFRVRSIQMGLAPQKPNVFYPDVCYRSGVRQSSRRPQLDNTNQLNLKIKIHQSTDGRNDTNNNNYTLRIIRNAVCLVTNDSTFRPDAEAKL